ncbi:MAG TPA: primase-helicase family protein [Sphingomicrobium sp.]|nr:primase-helicase family protein [Sphingomicrobium sp.]
MPPKLEIVSSALSKAADALSVDDFYAHMPSHSYIFIPSREFWPASSVNARIPPQDDGGDKPIAAAAWLDRNRPVEQMTWAPGEKMLIEDRLVAEGGWIDRPGCACFNLYREPARCSGDASNAGRWVDHVERVYPADADHIIKWLAHRVQRPHEKINHALVLGGAQGIGKDTILEPVKQAIGPWNFSEVSPQHMLGRFNGFLKSVILRVSEARDLGDVNRFAFYDHMKTYTAAPPDVLRIDEKHRQEYAIFNVCGVIITSNHKSDGIYLPADDRRHYVAWSDLTKDDFGESYWRELWGWYSTGGQADVAAHLREVDLSGFDAKAPPRKTDAFWSIVDSNRAPEDAELADALERLGNPSAVTLSSIISATNSDSFKLYLQERKNSRQIPFRLEECGYEALRNPSRKDGLWVFQIEGRKVVYARKELSIRERFEAAEALVSRTNAGSMSAVDRAWHAEYGQQRQ